MDENTQVRGVIPERAAVRSGGGCLIPFGLPFLAAGLAAMAAGIAQAADEPGLLVLVPFGGVFALIGAAFVFGRSGVEADRSTGKIRKWTSLIVRWKNTETPFEQITHVTLTRETRRSKNSHYTVYPVRLKYADGSIDVAEDRVYDRARNRAEQFAKVINVRIEDDSSGQTVVREPEHLDESVRDRLRRERRTAERPVEPDGCRVVSSAEGDSAVLEIPPKGMGPIEMVILAVVGLVGVGFAGGVMSMMFPFFKGETPVPVMIVGVIFGLVFLSAPLFMVFMIVSNARAVERVVVSPRELRVERKMPFRTKTVVVRTDELEELLIETPNRVTLGGRGGVISARSDRVTVQFGAALNHAEREWLLALVTFIVTA